MSEMVDWVHTRLLARYGSRWISMYADVSPDLVRSDWVHQIGRLPRAAIEYGLENLPADWPPNSAEFRVICCSRPADTFRLPAPAQRRRSAEEWAELGGRLRQAVRPKVGVDWAQRLLDEERLGRTLTEAQRSMARDALRGQASAPITPGEFRGINPDLLPPAMRQDIDRNEEMRRFGPPA